MFWDRFDIVAAHFTFAVDYHSGQSSALYARIGRILRYFTPGAAWTGYNSLSENGKAIYNRLANPQLYSSFLTAKE
jgi:hypothetical protein